ncbi:hypothetical protein CGC54_02545 [Capnocytophaga canimorsus]|uniref:Uncharacterized protein n=1 Tax=Capnocytophaga canimorsus TaxID=28188 RepID=A0AAC9Z2B1_9FLAO|nr:hypothetical protein CGC54_02545 [Capnocytophaga canimorsus]
MFFLSLEEKRERLKNKSYKIQDTNYKTPIMRNRVQSERIRFKNIKSFKIKTQKIASILSTLQFQ